FSELLNACGRSAVKSPVSRRNFMRRTVLMLLVSAALLIACTPESVPVAEDTAAAPATVAVTDTAAIIQTATSAPTQMAQSEQCPSIVAQALTAVDSACQRTGRNQICYGNVQLSAEFREG